MIELRLVQALIREPLVCMNYDPRVADSYTTHLGKVSEQHACIAQADVHNEFGVLLIKKGDPISAKLAEKLGDHRLDQDIDEAIGLEGALTGEELLQDFQVLYSQYADINAIQDQRGAEGLLDSLCLSQTLPRVLMQKLSVLRIQFPHQFQHSLLGAWLVGLFTLAAQWSNERIHEAFCAALFRDLGLLHIDAELVSQIVGVDDQCGNTGLTAEQRRAQAAHPLLAKRIIVDSKSYSDEVALAIVEHHEHPAGIGYPAGKTSRAMSEMGSALALAELLCQRCCRADGCSFAGAEYYLHAASSIYKSPLYGVVYLLLRNTQFSSVQGVEDSEKISARSIDRMLSIGAIFAFLVSLQQQSIEAEATLEGDKSAKRFSLRIEQAIMLLHTTGLASIDLLSLLDELKSESSNSELLDTEIVQLEFLHIVEHVYRLGAKWLLQDKSLGKPLKESMISNLKSIKEVLAELE